MANQRERDVSALAETIVRYLKSRPNAGDSLEGVVDWWLKLQQYEEATERVHRALELLAVKKVVVKTTHGDRIFYRVKQGEPGTKGPRQ